MPRTLHISSAIRPSGFGRPAGLLRLLRPLAVAAALVVADAAVLRGQQTAAADAANLVLGPGDAVKLSVWKAPELSGEFPVAADGTLAHPAFPSLVVAGVPLPRLQRMLDSAARIENVSARVVVQPLFHVVVDGEVRAPSLYHYPAGTSIAEAIALAGGRTERADVRRIRLVRGGESRSFDLTEPGGPASRVAVASGDQLVVARRSSFRESVLPFATLLGTAASVATLIVRSQ